LKEEFAQYPLLLFTFPYSIFGKPVRYALFAYRLHCQKYSNHRMRYKLILLTGLILVAVSIYKLKQSIDFIGRSEQAVGIVTSLEENDGAYSPVFSVKTKEHGSIVYHHSLSTSPPAWTVGEEALFLYDPRKPDSATMMRYFWLFSWTIFFMAIGIPLVIVGAGYYFLHPLIRLTAESL
jgi:ABC-type cobalt transport system substrate-binding protein